MGKMLRQLWFPCRVSFHRLGASCRQFRSSVVLSSSSSVTFSAGLAWYSKRLETHPLLTKGVTSGIIAGTGDAICQWMVGFSKTDDDAKEEGGWDRIRTGRFVLLGALWVAPVTHVWYQALATRVVPGPRSRTKVLQRLVVDQLAFAPLFCCSFLTGLWMLEGQSNIYESLGTVGPSVIQANWALWIPAQLVNFGMVPLNYQVLFGNVVALSWNVYLSWINVTSRQQITDNNGATRRDEKP